MRKKHELEDKLKRILEEKEKKPALEVKKDIVSEDEWLKKITSELRDIPETEKNVDIGPKSIRDFEIPSGVIEKVSNLGSVTDKAESYRLEQLLLFSNGRGVKLKWTVMRDPQAEEFAILLKSGSRQIKTNPPIYGFTMDDNVLICSHNWKYTFVLAGYGVDVDSATKIFLSALLHSKRQLRI